MVRGRLVGRECDCRDLRCGRLGIGYRGHQAKLEGNMAHICRYGELDT